jgi:hypothetical protein
MCQGKFPDITNVLQNPVLEKELDILPENRAYWVDFMVNDPDMAWFAPFKPRT